MPICMYMTAIPDFIILLPANSAGGNTWLVVLKSRILFWDVQTKKIGVYVCTTIQGEKVEQVARRQLVLEKRSATTVFEVDNFLLN